MKSKPTWAPSSRTSPLDASISAGMNVGSTVTSTWYGTFARVTTWVRPQAGSLRRTTSSTRAKPGCLSTTATGPIRTVTSAVGMPPQAPWRETTTLEKPRETPSSGAYCENVALELIQPSGKTPVWVFRKRVGGWTRQSCIPLRGSPTFSPRTSTPFPVTTQRTPGSGLSLPSGPPRSGDSDGSGAVPSRLQILSIE